MPEGSTSGSDVCLIAEEHPQLSDPDWTWLARWLAEALGISVRVVLSRGIPGISTDERQPVVCYGDAQFVRLTTATRPDAIGLARSPDDWLALAVRWLHREEAPRDHSPAAVVDRGVRALGGELDRRVPALSRAPYWPGDHSCAVVLTHDVDAVERWSRAHVLHLARHVPERFPKEGVRSVLRLPWAAMRGLWEPSDLGRRLQECVAIEQQAAVRSTYFFFSPETRYRRALDGWYTPETPIGNGRTVGSLWKDLMADDFEIGLHLSIGAHDDPAEIAAEWNLLRASVPTLATYRSHYLKRKRDVTEAALQTLGARVELNVVGTGFSRGSGLPFVFLDGEPALYRLPTVLGDAELQTHGGDPALQERLWEIWRGVLDETSRNRSIAVLLLHPENPGANDMLRRVISWAQGERAWMPTVSELMEHWHARSTGAKFTISRSLC